MKYLFLLFTLTLNMNSHAQPIPSDAGRTPEPDTIPHYNFTENQQPEDLITKKRDEALTALQTAINTTKSEKAKAYYQKVQHTAKAIGLKTAQPGSKGYKTCEELKSRVMVPDGGGNFEFCPRSAERHSNYALQLFLERSIVQAGMSKDIHPTCGIMMGAISIMNEGGKERETEITNHSCRNFADFIIE